MNIKCMCQDKIFHFILGRTTNVEFSDKKNAIRITDIDNSEPWFLFIRCASKENYERLKDAHQKKYLVTATVTSPKCQWGIKKYHKKVELEKTYKLFRFFDCVYFS